MKKLKPKSWSVSYSAHYYEDGSEVESSVNVQADSIMEAYDKAKKILDTFDNPDIGDPIFFNYVIWDIGIVDDNVWPELEEVDDQ